VGIADTARSHPASPVTAMASAATSGDFIPP
jgi:hypothetical protein